MCKRLLCGLTLLIASTGFAQTEQSTLLPTDSFNGSNFGFATAVDGDTAVVGQRNGRNASSETTGAAYVYVRQSNSWSAQAKLLGSSALVLGDFGRSVAISGDTIAVGAAGNASAGGQLGRVYVFTRNGSSWTEQQLVNNPAGLASDFFGASVALQGDTLVVGANGQRKAVVFTRTAGVWSEQQTLTDNDDSTGFGASVALDGQTLAVGAPGYLNMGVGQGGVFVFTRSSGTWSQNGNALIAANGAQNHFLGATVALHADTIVAGAPSFFPPGGSFISPQGAAYVFVRNAGSFSQQIQLIANDAAAGDRFGSGVAVFADRVVVGAPFDNASSPAGNNVRGGAYVYNRTGSSWDAGVRFAPVTQINGDRFGRGVAMKNNTLVIGADQNNAVATQGPGNAIVFEFQNLDLYFKNGFE
jgi:FG-GAP repeat